MSPNAVMIFAAGLGKRMGALTAQRPKPLVEVAGKPLIDHALELTEPLMPLTRVVNLHHRGEMLRDHLAGRDVVLSDETDHLLETGGGLRKARPLLGPGPVFTLNSDAIWSGPNPLSTLKRAWDPSRMEALLLLLHREDALAHNGQGDFLLDAEGRLSRGPGYVYSGAQIVVPDGLDAIPEQAFSLNLLWNDIAARGRLYGVVHDGRWCDVGRPDCIPLAETMLRDDHVL
ncbi:nucleotidyltransferase family protein [Limimaricola pyoseonensis]|uniref:MobA-like NTP transferase domain-containing protein n=1 Tax=Limimaricola pyoseonensis TaxID=521013 RepID=A0A1G7EKW1_9RHOB|nr:nucleotidyltransferase family protein [Limimaricola pyoseonensis]SDE64288.1 MobA-like NTP transferase domain-containing protein [Limimaricola pyoseonensis]